MTTCSIVKGKGNLNHNTRQNRHSVQIPEKEKENKYLVNQSLEDTYQELFGEAVKEYNDNQSDPRRQISNYLDKVQRSKQEKPFYELVIEIGSIEDIEKGSEDEERCRKALDNYVQQFMQRNKNFKVFLAARHEDEQGLCHYHIDFVPFSTGNKRGLRVKNSLSGAFTEMGYKRNGFAEWREDEQKHLIQSMTEQGLVYTEGKDKHPHMNTTTYKQYKEEISDLKKERYEFRKELQSLKQKIDSFEIELTDIENEIAYSKDQLEDLQTKKENVAQEIIDEKKETLQNASKTILEAQPAGLSRKYYKISETAYNELKTALSDASEAIEATKKRNEQLESDENWLNERTKEILKHEETLEERERIVNGFNIKNSKERKEWLESIPEYVSLKNENKSLLEHMEEMREIIDNFFHELGNRIAQKLTGYTMKNQPDQPTQRAIEIVESEEPRQEKQKSHIQSIYEKLEDRNQGDGGISF